MPIARLTKEIVTPRIGVWDLEWYPYTLRPRIGVLVDGINKPFATESLDELVDRMLSKEAAGTWWFAHAGGSYDMLFILELLRKRSDLTVSLNYSGAAIVRAEVKRGEDTWVFCDSFFLLRTSLRKIGQSLGKHKGGKQDSTKLFYAELEELIPYCIMDCEILYDAIQGLAQVLADLGGELAPTIASCALKLFRRKYLAKTLRTDKNWNRRLRPAYVASRVEVFRKHGKNLYQWDINSSFPYSMTFAQPGEKGRITSRLPTSEQTLFFADVTVTIPERYVPPLPYRIAGRVYFPTGTWRQWYADVDVRLAEQCGRIEKVHKVVTYDANYDLRSYVEDIYQLRLNTKKPFEKDVFKLLLNALYGKFGERSLKESIFVNSPEEADLRARGAVEMSPGILRLQEEVDVKHEHVCMSARITALSRKWIFQYLEGCVEAGTHPYYTDTDCVVTEMPIVKNMGNELGQVKLEGDKPIADFEAYAAKFYVRDGKVKAKGFSRMSLGSFRYVTGGDSGMRDPSMQIPSGVMWDPETGEEIDLGDRSLDAAAPCVLLDGSRRPAVAIGRMERSKGLLRRFQIRTESGHQAEIRPLNITVPKTLRLDVTKRRFDASGDSEPYDVAYLQERHAEG